MTSLRTSEKFERRLNKIDNTIRLQIDKLIDKIVINQEVGKPMKYDRKGTREVYANPFRLSYSYDKSSDTLFLLNLYHKDKQ